MSALGRTAYLDQCTIIKQGCSNQGSYCVNDLCRAVYHYGFSVIITETVTARDWVVTEKGLINYCRVEWIKGGALPVIVAIMDVLPGYLSVYFGIYWQLLRTIVMGNLAIHSHIFQLNRIPQ